MRSWEPPFIGSDSKSRGRRWYSMAGNSGHLWCQLWGEEEGAVPFNGGKWKRRSSDVDFMRMRWPEGTRLEGRGRNPKRCCRFCPTKNINSSKR
jgi:hypothetical protein